MQISISEAKKTLNRIISLNRITLITKNGKPKAAIVPYENYVKMLRIQREHEDLASIRRAEEYFNGDKYALSQKDLDEKIKS